MKKLKKNWISRQIWKGDQRPFGGSESAQKCTILFDGVQIESGPHDPLEAREPINSQIAGVGEKVMGPQDSLEVQSAKNMSGIVEWRSKGVYPEKTWG